jgi:predicted O-linked N-acetylglucosamine transferase (SPINDLY family)
MEVLRATPHSVLWLLECNPWARNNLQQMAVAHDIAPERLIFAPRMPIAQHLARHRCADLFLDTLPYNAHTTTSDALWMGLPVLTCAGDTFAGRVAGSLLRAAGLSELVTDNLQAYQDRALQLASQPQRLHAIREQLEQTRARMPLFDTQHFARQLEDLFHVMWSEYRSGLLAHQ